MRERCQEFDLDEAVTHSLKGPFNSLATFDY